MHRYHRFLSYDENNSKSSDGSSQQDSFGLPSLLDDSLVIFRTAGRYVVKKIPRTSSSNTSTLHPNSSPSTNSNEISRYFYFISFI